MCRPWSYLGDRRLNLTPWYQSHRGCPKFIIKWSFVLVQPTLTDIQTYRAYNWPLLYDRILHCVTSVQHTWHLTIPLVLATGRGHRGFQVHHTVSVGSLQTKINRFLACLLATRTHSQTHVWLNIYMQSNRLRFNVGFNKKDHQLSRWSTATASLTKFTTPASLIKQKWMDSVA